MSRPPTTSRPEPAPRDLPGVLTPAVAAVAVHPRDRGHRAAGRWSGLRDQQRGQLRRPLTITFLLHDMTPILLIALPMTLIIITGEIDLSVASVVGLSSVLVGVLHQDGGCDPGRRRWSRSSSACSAARSTASWSRTSGSRRWRSPSAPWRSTAASRSACSAPPRSPTSRVVDRPAKANIRGRRYPEVIDPARGRARDLRVPAALHVLRPRHLRRSASTPRPPTSPGSTSRAPSSVLFMLAGVVSALAGIYYTLRFGSARGDNATGLELSVIAAVLLGGVSIFGGRGALHGVVAGVLLIGVLAAPCASRASRSTSSTSSRAAARALGDVHELPGLGVGRRRRRRNQRQARSRAEAAGRRRTPRKKGRHMMFHSKRRAAPWRVAGPRAAVRSPPAAATATAAGGGGDGARPRDHLPAEEPRQRLLRHRPTRAARRQSRSSAAPTRGRSAAAGRPTARSPSSTPRRSRASAPSSSRPTTPTALCDAINEARDAGIKVVTFDSDTDARLPRRLHQPGRGRGHRQGPGRPDRRADRRRRSDRDPVRHGQRHEPERLDRDHGAADSPSEPPEHRAGRDRLRRRRRPDVVRQDGGAAAVLPRPEGHHLAHDRRHLGGRSLPLRPPSSRARSC